MSLAKSSLEQGIATFVVSLSVAQADPAILMNLADMEDMKPMGLEEIASVFPVAGPFAGTSESSDHFLKEFMEEIQPAFRGKLISILASRFPDSAHPCEEDVRTHCSHQKNRSPLHCLGLHAQHISPRCREEIRHTVPFGCSEEIHRHCGHGPPAGLLRCLEDVGVHLGFRCADAIIAARQALASIGWSDKHAQDHHHGQGNQHKHHDHRDHHDHHDHQKNHDHKHHDHQPADHHHPDHKHHSDRQDHHHDHKHHSDHHDHSPDHKHHSDHHDHSPDHKHHSDHYDHSPDHKHHSEHHHKHLEPHHGEHQDHVQHHEHAGSRMDHNHQGTPQQHDPHRPQRHHDPRSSSSCPPGWEGPKAGGCCTRRWSPRCNLSCSLEDCRAASGWEFRWADFRTHPYICCPKVTRHHYLGGQPICPKGWEVEEHGHGHCCRKSWTWGCGEHCAFEECKQDLALEWYPVDDKTENYKCCPDMRLMTPEGETDLPNLVTVGSSLVSRPVDLSAVTFTQVLCVAGVLLGAALMCRFALNCWWTFRRQHLHKDQ